MKGLASLLIPSTRAFTNGTLIPSYLCDLRDLMAGGPQSLGDVIPLLKEDDSQAKIAGYHKVETNATGYAAQNLCTAMLAENTVFAVTGNQFMVKTLGGENLLGVIVWMQDYPPNFKGYPRRIGQFTSPGKNMMQYPYRCGQTIVHTATLDDDATVKSQTDVMTWNTPACGVWGQMMEVRGVCVTDKGYGKFQVKVPTGGIAPAESLNATAGCDLYGNVNPLVAAGGAVALPAAGAEAQMPAATIAMPMGTMPAAAAKPSPVPVPVAQQKNGVNGTASVSVSSAWVPAVSVVIAFINFTLLL
ncbi:hypothetical protein HDU98_006633 [Podochytrium sp. JEL0797]|nr:hypothetical protein HDU98_006633 [Podochytrium sp. JEL0797]